MISKWLFAIVAGVAVASCGGSGAPSVKSRQESTKLDLTTPDRALKSYWAMQDLTWQDDASRSDPSATRLAPLLTGGAEADLKAPHTTLVLDRDILELKQESDSRASAVVRIRNATPPPAGAVTTEYINNSREKGDRYKYVLEKVNAEWRVSEIWAFWEWKSPPEWQRRTGNKPTVSAYTVP
jgi:hypothetical protein